MEVIDVIAKASMEIAFSSTMMTMKHQLVTPRKPFRELGAHSKRERTKILIDKINEFMSQENMSDVSLTELAGYVIFRENCQSSKSIASIGMKIFEGTYNVEQKFSIEDAIVMMHTLVLTKEQLRKMRCFLQSKDIVFPTTNDIRMA